MLFRVDPGSELGLAEQIAAQVRGALVAGSVQPGEKLPAARELAAGLEVNMHTVLRAYSLLRDEGLIDLRRGRGAQVRADADIAGVELDEQIRHVLTAAARLGIGAEQLAARVRTVAAKRGTP